MCLFASVPNWPWAAALSSLSPPHLRLKHECEQCQPCPPPSLVLEHSPHSQQGEWDLPVVDLVS